MDDNELDSMLSDIESDRVERKASLSDPDRVREAICAFANDLPNYRKPGVVFIGANDDGSCAHLEVSDQLLLTLSDMRSDGNILPLPAITVQKRTLAGGDMAVVIVQPSDAPPVRYKGRVCIRVGPRRAVASQQEERILSEKRRARDIPFDIRGVPSASIDDLDVDVFRREYLPAAVASDVIDQNNRTVEQQLVSLRLASPEPEVRPTLVGILAIGKDPRSFVPGAYVQFLRIDGLELTDPIKDARDIDGPLRDMLRMLDETFTAHISTATDITSEDIEIRHPDYPLVALQQLARNAIMHRTYEGTNAPVRVSWFNDRIEIQNPGGPYGMVTQENFGQLGITDYRNPHLAEVMRNLGYVQRFGVGIQLARNAMVENHNPPPEFNAQVNHVLVTLRRMA